RQNDAPREQAKALVRRGWAGLVTGHTHHAELTLFGDDAFYANVGSCSDVMSERPARLGLPPVFLAQRQLTWLEIEAGAELHARLVHGVTDLPGSTRPERLAARRLPDVPPRRPSVVGSFPQGPAWPSPSPTLGRARRVRRIGAALIATAGVINLVSALTPPLRHRLHTLEDLVPLPLAVPQFAAALVALSGLGLLLVARGVRRGQRHAWQIAIAVLTVSAALHLVKGLDPEESLITLGVAAYLARHRSAFRARTDLTSLRKGLLGLGIGAVVAISAATAAVEFIRHGRTRPPFGDALRAVLGHMLGQTWVDVPGRVDNFLGPVLLSVTVGLMLLAGWQLFRPVVARRVVPGDDRARARAVVAAHGGDTLAYFALRDDKQYFFFGSSMVAYAVVGGIALVSPDPIGPVTERDQVWTAFRHFADERAWPIAVMGAGEEWLPIYRASGMHDLYVGDEAVLDVARFSLEGGQAKGLRQAVNRVAKYGYRIEFHDPAHLDPELRRSLEAMMGRSRRGEVERGFSMTLGRVFCPDDEGLLLAVAFGPDGAPGAFCQYVPAPDIEGYSLDLMRRADDGGPNGVTDFVVVETIRYLREKGFRGLALNFATMRAVLAGESGDRITQRVERWLLQKMSDSMQIESLWYFNAKYDPEWRPRYAVYDAPEHLLPAAMAVARAESFWELPIIGRFLVPSGGGPAPAPEPEAEAE
ncbi:MAG: bifunctional lysylphosphatidylglycerol flippase/synthetase MprF, partial [Acidimicrobiales bacterium]